MEMSVSVKAQPDKSAIQIFLALAGLGCLVGCGVGNGRDVVVDALVFLNHSKFSRRQEEALHRDVNKQQQVLLAVRTLVHF